MKIFGWNPSKTVHKVLRGAKRTVGLPVQADMEEEAQEARRRIGLMEARERERAAELERDNRARRANIRNRQRGRGLLLYANQYGLKNKLGG